MHGLCHTRKGKNEKIIQKSDSNTIGHFWTVHNHKLLTLSFNLERADVRTPVKDEPSASMEDCAWPLPLTWLVFACIWSNAASANWIPRAVILELQNMNKKCERKIIQRILRKKFTKVQICLLPRSDHKSGENST